MLLQEAAAAMAEAAARAPRPSMEISPPRSSLLASSVSGEPRRLETGDADSPMAASWRIMLTAREPLTRGAAEPADERLECARLLALPLAVPPALPPAVPPWHTPQPRAATGVSREAYGRDA